MNIETGEIRDEKDIPANELLDGKWVRVAPKIANKYKQKEILTLDDQSRVIQAEVKRMRKAARNLAARANGGGNV